MQTKLLNPHALSAQVLLPWIVLFIGLHTIIWTGAPLLVRHTLPMDALETTIWGHQLDWGYDKNPYLNGWLAALAVYLGGSSGWTLYLFSQLAVALCFWCVWQLGKKIVLPIYAFIAVLSLEAMQYYNLHAIDFNDNTLELGLWAATVLFFYEALTQHKWRDWVLTGVFAGFGMMTKYYTAMLLLPMFFFMFLLPEGRQAFRQWSFYVALIVFAAIMAPHLVWLFQHDFVTVNYAANRIDSPPAWTNHVVFPLKFAYQQLEVLIPALVVCLLLFGKKQQAVYLSPPLKKFDKLFLYVIGFGPYLLTVLLSVIGGIKLRSGWGQPLLTYWILIFIAWATPLITWERLQRFLVALTVLTFGTVLIYCVALIMAGEPSSANFPAKQIALSLEQEWHARFKQKIPYVVGPRWLAGNIAFYSHDHPAVYMEADKTVSPWINEDELRKSGAIFVWDPTEETQNTYQMLKYRFTQIGPLQTRHFAWLRNHKMPAVEMQLAFLPPI